MATETCAHVKALCEYLRANGLDIWSEHGEEPSGWVNVHCKACGVTHETSLDPNLNRSGEFDGP